jgi:formate C-acetyltransferase
MSYINPSSLYSATIVTSLEKARDGYQDGVKYCNSALLCCGLATAVDAIMAVWQLVEKEKLITVAQLKEALNANWVGYERLRAKVRRSVHKFGNCDTETDRIACAVAALFTDRVNGRKNARGGVYKPVLHSAMQFVWQGEKTEATPDGRRAGEEISKNGSPTPGADTKGVTALILSALKLSPTSFPESFCLYSRSTSYF